MRGEAKKKAKQKSKEYCCGEREDNRKERKGMRKEAKAMNETIGDAAETVRHSSRYACTSPHNMTLSTEIRRRKNLIYRINTQG